jgi:Rrf2 family protein
MLSKKTRYAMVALVRLTKEYGKGPILIANIAKEERIPQRFLEGILLELKKMGVLGSQMGRSGGYFLTKKPEDIKLSEIIASFEGAIAMMPCVSEKNYQPCEFCKDENICNIRKVFLDIRDFTYLKLKNTTLLDLAEGRNEKII